MKKVLMSLGAVLAFFGLSTFIIFFAETTTNANYATPQSNLLADISANNPVDATADAPADQTADVAVTAPVPPATPPDESADPSADFPVVPTATPDASVPIPPPAVPAQVATNTLPSLGPIPVDDGADNFVSTSTLATATITVTPTAAPPPPQLQAPAVKTPSADDLALPYAEPSFSGDDNWQTTWGLMRVTYSGAMDLYAGTNSAGAGVYLQHASVWSNYTMNTTLDWVGGRSLDLMAAYDDASNYVSCEYTKADSGTIAMQLMQHVNGYEIALSPEVSVPWDGNGSNLGFSMSVNGVYGSCSFNGETISNDGAGPGRSAMSFPVTGSVGFSVSDPLSGAPEVIINDLNVL